MADGEAVFTSTGLAGYDSNLLLDYNRKIRLYCLNGGHHLQMRPDGTVHGQRDEDDVYTVLRLKAVEPGVVVIQGVETGKYLAMSNAGHLHSSRTVSDECYFVETLEENHYNTYQPQKYKERSWYVGLKKNGKPKPGPRTHIGQKAIFFLPRRLVDTGQ